MGEEMFFVIHGKLDVYMDDHKLGELEAGDFFGEGTLMGISERLEATIQATQVHTSPATQPTEDPWPGVCCCHSHSPGCETRWHACCLTRPRVFLCRTE